MIVTPRVTLPNLTPGVTYYFTVVAANADGVSEPSDVLTYRIPKPPGKPNGLQVVEIQTSSNNAERETLAFVPGLKKKEPARFVRAGLTVVETLAP